MLDEKYIETCTKEGCELNDGNKDGLGTGRKMNISEKNVINNNIVNKNKIKGGNEGSEGHHDKVDALLTEVNSMKEEDREAAIEKIKNALANLENSNEDNSQEQGIVEDLKYD